METFEHHLPPSREGSAGSDHGPAGDPGPLQSRQHTGLQQHGGSPGRGCQEALLHTLSTIPNIHLVTGNGHCCRIRQASCSTVGRKEFPKGPQLSTGHAARPPGLGKTPPPFVERRALSPHKPSPPPDVIHPSQQKSHLQNANIYESPVGLAVFKLFWKYHTTLSQYHTALAGEGANITDHESSWQHCVAEPSNTGRTQGH